MKSLMIRLRALAYPPDGPFDRDFRKTYFILRQCIGGLGLLVPIVLVGAGLINDIPWSQMGSISAFYWLSPTTAPTGLLRDFFVGPLSAVGVCLIIYKGYGDLEDWLLNCAGGALLSVAFFPMAWPPSQEHTPQFTVHFSVHDTAAVSFFLLIAATVWLCAGTTLGNLTPEEQKRWIRWYRLLAILMAVAPLAAWALATRGHQTLMVEMAGIGVFSGYWFLKTYELQYVSRLEPKEGQAPELERVEGIIRRLS